MRVTNNAAGLQGIHTTAGVVYLKPGETRDLDLDEMQVKQVIRLPFIALEGVERGSAMQAATSVPLVSVPCFSVLDKGRGWFVITADGVEVTKSLRKDDVDGFDEMSEGEKALFIKANKADD